VAKALKSIKENKGHGYREDSFVQFIKHHYFCIAEFYEELKRPRK
jgi:hypothetical protein